MNLSNGSAAAPQLAFNSNYGLYYEATPLQSGSVGMAMALNASAISNMSATPATARCASSPPPTPR
ncbi:MAG: hypothetical protein WDN06_00575 [Asticcacaulis sp.]